ncbi:hypothetical protein V500_02027 [Pseudogymnoascus sp. VKM F-4518 (FW-2643)]|nr:hypothetical protein V500_02027 [Pseudogymnoascus sp. VKM F-4518 (FW-2643)]
MDFKEISDFFNGTICSEEYRTDLEDADSRIRQLESRITSFSITQDRATILILRSLHATMTGNLSQSENYLINLSTLAEEAEDQSLISRCRIFQHHIRSLKKLPPFLRFRSDADTGSGPISDATLDRIGNLKRFVDFCTARRQSWSGIERLEIKVIRYISNLPNNLWMAAFHHHPNYNASFCAPLFDSSKPCESWFINDAKRLGLLRTSRYMERLNVEYLLAGGSSEGRTELSKLFLCYHNDGDFIGAGNCMMMQADNALSLPFTSPIALNLYAVDTEFGIEQLKTFGVSELVELPLRKDQSAVSNYKEAYALFDKGMSDRGKAAICLRFACLDFAEYIEIITAGGSAPAGAPQPGDVRNSVHTELEKAFKWFQEDGPNTQIVAGYRVLLNIILPEEQNYDDGGKSVKKTVTESAADIGTWGRENGNIAVSQFVGLLMARVGKKICKTPRNLSMASHCFACSRACFHALEDYLLELHAIVSQAQLQKQHGNLELARTYMETGHSILSQAVGGFKLFSNTPSEDYRQTLRMQRNNTVANFGQVASTIYENDTRRKEKFEQLASTIYDNDPIRKEDFGQAASTIYENDTRRNEGGGEERDKHFGASTIAALVGSLPDNMFMDHDSSAATTGSATPLGDTKSESLPEILSAMLSSSSGNIMETFKKFISQRTPRIDEIQEGFDKAVKNRRVALVDHTDVDEADNCLREFISSLGDTAAINSTQVYTIEAVALQYIGDFDTARKLLPRAIPDIFGGKLPTSMPIQGEDFGDVQLDMLAVQRKNHAQRSIAMCFLAKDWKLGAEVLQNIREELPKFFDEIRTREEGADWYLMTWIASIEYQNGNFASAFNWYLRALQVIEKTRSRLADDKDRRDIFSTIHSAELFVGLAKTVLRFPDLTNSEKFNEVCDIWKFRGPTWMDEAILFLEKGRARVLLDLLIPEVASKEFVEWKDWSHQLRESELEASPATKSDIQEENFHNWLTNLETDLEKEKKSPSLAFIVKELQWTTDVTQLYQSIPADAIVVHINISRDGLLVLGVTDSGVELVHTSDTTDIEMQRHALHYLKPFQDIVDGNPPKENYEAMMATITMLSDQIIKPISKVIANRSHIIFVPSSFLNKFPFSALLLDGKPIFLKKAVSVAPSLSVLQHLVERDRKRKRPETKEQKAAVTFRNPLEKRPLNLSAAASIEIAQRLGCKPRLTHEVDVEEFSNSYQNSNVMLIATHGDKGIVPNHGDKTIVPNQYSAWKAYISLKEDFKVLELVKLEGRATLVVFEACLSGLGESVGNEVLGFSYSILSSGASSFIGSLWKVSDLASACIMSFLFAELLKIGSEPDSSFASCLRRAQKQLYKADASEIISILKRFKTVCEQLDTETENKILAKAQLRKILNALDAAIKDEGDENETGGHPYAHPFFWAPFVLVGCGSLSL